MFTAKLRQRTVIANRTLTSLAAIVLAAALLTGTAAISTPPRRG